jgi:drug/metabolite transporter (DMT)-like permease
VVEAVLLSLAASFCTATSSVCQRLGAQRHIASRAETGGAPGRKFDGLLVFRLARQPVWLAGFACMVLGFVFQVSALHFGPLALVQPILAVELVLVFGYLAVLTRFQGVRWREWLAAVAMAAGISVFLRAAGPAGGLAHAPAVSWWLAGLGVFAVVAVAIGAANAGTARASASRASASRAGASPARRAALLGVATGMGWGFVSAVIKELSSHVDGGPGAIFTTWSVYVLMVAGAAAMLLAAHAMAAGPLAAAQPGFTLGDPVVAVLLGAFLFGEHLRATPTALTAEVLGLIVLAAGVLALSRSRIITSDAVTAPRRLRPAGKGPAFPAG